MTENISFFWVNHKQTATQERGNNGKGSKDGYIWSPQRNKNGARNETYENLKDVKIGDIIFSYANTKIEFVGIARSTAQETIKPVEFGNTGENWNNIGWKINVDFSYKLSNPFKPKDHLDKLINLLPPKYSPIQKNGNGNQGCYLAKLPTELGLLILKFCNATDLIEQNEATKIAEDLEDINKIENISETQKKRLMEARIGQGKFRKDVLDLYPQCPVTKTSIKCLLRASHILPWRISDNKQRLDPYNGLMLAAHVDALFDKGYVSFDDDGLILISSTIKAEIESLGISPKQKISIYEKNKPYLKWHRENIFKE